MVTGIFVEFPNPQKEFRLCGRRNASFICDPEHILDIGDVERLDQLADEFRKSTSCLCSQCEVGTSLGIFIRSKLTEESTVKYPTGRSVAEMLRKRWHLGKCNDDVVIILLTEMNISDYSLGAAVKEILPDETAQLIMEDCNVHFLSGWYYQGLESVVTSFSDMFLKLQKEKKSFNKSLITGLSLGIGVLLILLILAVLLLCRQSKRRKQGCSDIYESVPTDIHNENLINDKIKKYELQKSSNQSNSIEDDEESEEEISTFGRQFLQPKRQLSAVAEESDDNDTFKDIASFKLTYSPQNTTHPLQVTEL